MLTFDFSDIERKAKALGAAPNQVRFAVANAMTSAAFDTRTMLITDVWPRSVQVRNKTFLPAALRVEKARKDNLAVSIVDVLGRGNLALHAKGGVEAPRSGRFAIPPAGSVQRGARGVFKAQRPAAIISSTPKRALRVTSRGIFVGSDGRLHLKYSFKSSANIRADVPFEASFNRYFETAFEREFGLSVRRAMETAFR